MCVCSVCTVLCSKLNSTQTSTPSYHVSYPVQVFTSNDPESEVALWSGLLFLLGVVSGVGIFIKACIILYIVELSIKSHLLGDLNPRSVLYVYRYE